MKGIRNTILIINVKIYNYNTYVQLQYEINDDDDETNRVNMRVY